MLSLLLDQFGQPSNATLTATSKGGAAMSPVAVASAAFASATPQDTQLAPKTGHATTFAALATGEQSAFATPRTLAVTGSTSSTFAPSSAKSVGGSISWVNPEYVYVQDTNRATFTFPGGTSGQAVATFAYLYFQGFNANIPDGSTILGITVNVVARQNGGTAGQSRFDTVSLVKGDVVTGDNKATTASLTSGDAAFTYGSDSDTWGLTLTAADVNSPTFGFAIRPTGSTPATNRVEGVNYGEVAIAYLPPQGTSTSFTAANTSGTSFAPAYAAQDSFAATTHPATAFGASYALPGAFSATSHSTTPLAARYVVQASLTASAHGTISLIPTSGSTTQPPAPPLPATIIPGGYPAGPRRRFRPGTEAPPEVQETPEPPVEEPITQPRAKASREDVEALASALAPEIPHTLHDQLAALRADLQAMQAARDLQARDAEMQAAAARLAFEQERARLAIEEEQALLLVLIAASGRRNLFGRRA